MEKEKRSRVPQQFSGGKFELSKKLGEGCFGEVYLGIDTKERREVAIKLERIENAGPSQLETEAVMLSLLRTPQAQQGFVEHYFSGKEGGFNCMVMELLSKSIEDYVQKCKGKFNNRTTGLVAEQVLIRIEYLHSKGIVHRDIKPENFMFGSNEKIHHVYLIDFGLSKRYWKDKNHVPLRQKLNLTGTARYASIHAHKGVEQSRRDDLEAIGHMFMYFLRGALPWSGLDAKTKNEKYRKIMEKKETVPLDELCEGYPDEFKTYLAIARGLGFEERPAYDKFYQLFRQVRELEGVKEDWQYEWFDNKAPPQPLVPLAPRGRTLQPDDPDDAAGSRRVRRGFCFCGGQQAVDD